MRITIDEQPLHLDDLAEVLKGGLPRLRLSKEGRRRIEASRQVIEDVLESGEVVYGVNTGFGKLSRERVDREDLARLQVNLLRSHACGVGEPLPVEVVRAMLLLRVRALCQGYSGVRVELVRTMMRMLEADIVPVVPAQGSVGASGDLAPLAHLALPLMGEGTVVHGGVRRPAAEALAEAGIRPLELQAKEGLALINGTQVSCVLGADAAIRARRLLRTADLVCALSLEALKGTNAAFDAKIHRIRGQRGQIRVARNLRRLMKGSEILRSHVHCDRVQDPYCLRCAPQVHGAARDSIDEACRVFEAELDAVTDNPLVFPETGQVLSGGNFHAQPVAASSDRVAAAIADLSSISERRIENLVNPDLSQLPAFLTPRPGLCSGFMIPQVVAAALVSENKALSFPAAVDSIPTSANKEDHVSMGPIAARKARDVVTNAERVVAIELLAACQGLDFEKQHRPGVALRALHRWVRRRIPTLVDDRVLHEEIETAAGWVRDGELLAVATRAGVSID